MQYYRKHKDRIIERVRKKREENREAYRRAQREYRERHHEKCLERERAYYEKNRERILGRKRTSQRLRARIAYWEKKWQVEPTKEHALRLRAAQEDLATYLEDRALGLIE